MADKKVDRSGRERPLTPTQKMKAALSDSGTVNMADPTHDKGKSALVDKFREREERWRQRAGSSRSRGRPRGASNRRPGGQLAEAGEPAEPRRPG